MTVLLGGGILYPFSCSSALVQGLEFGHFWPHDQLRFTVLSAAHPVLMKSAWRRWLGRNLVLFFSDTHRWLCSARASSFSCRVLCSAAEMEGPFRRGPGRDG